MMNTKPYSTLQAMLLGIICGVSLLFSPIIAAAEAEGLALVAHPPVQLNNTPRTYLNLFLMRQTTDQQGHALTLFTLDPSTQAYEQFVSQCLHWNPRFLARRWQRSLFTGEGRTPNIVNDWKQMQTQLLNTPSAIGYLPASLVQPPLMVLKRCQAL